MGRSLWALLIAAAAVTPVERSTVTFTGESDFISVSVNQVEQTLQWFWVNLEVVATPRV